jgi:hypothetical protein
MLANVLFFLEGVILISLVYDQTQGSGAVFFITLPITLAYYYSYFSPTLENSYYFLHYNNLEIT